MVHDVAGPRLDASHPQSGLPSERAEHL